MYCLRNISPFLLLLMFVFVAGCETGFNEPKTEEKGPDPLSQAALSIQWFSPPHLRATPEQWERGKRTTGKFPIAEFVVESESWQAADEKVRAYLANQQDNEFLVLLEQMAGSAMIQRIQQAQGTSEERLEAVSYYTDLLVKNESNHYDVIYMGLSELRGHWDEARLRQAADAVVTYGTEREEAKFARIEAREKELQEQYGKKTEEGPTSNAGEIKRNMEAYASSGLRQIKALRDELAN